ncbi:CaiB/BaiF CoA transferase family protein [Nocardioides halotolerans]|uniref:CaiB/BaiF CoA transferase family protein n=1 Tax=Nocardioides halotolerans TaxID=433660 RepID=UPI00048D8852|nr:CaiB/BaiF CoA-transferase family protein [Nocardioides halotolerans]
MTRSGPLSGVRVLDLSRLLPGGACTLVLADLGADVVKVEEPGHGDYMRWIPPYSDEFGAMFSGSNRNKRSVTLDLKHPDGPDVLRRLAAGVDVVVESFRPGVADRIGAGYDELSRDNPKLVYCSVSGYGQTGPYVRRPGHDLNYLAASGLLSMTAPGGAPAALGPQVADVWGGGVTAAVAVLAALVGRVGTGCGRYLDVSMLDGSTFGLANHAPEWLVGRTAFEPGRQLLSGGVGSYGVYAARDGHVTVGDYEEKFWARTCELLGRPDLVEHHVDRDEGADWLREQLAGEFAKRTRAEWEELFAGEDTCFMPVLTVEEALDSEHFAERELVVEVPMDGDRTERQLSTPWTHLGAGDHRRAPRIGEHTTEVLAEIGLSPDEVSELVDRKVV